MDNITIKASALSKNFGTHTVFKELGFSISMPCSIAVTGPNGSGKSTLLEIIAGIKRPSQGSLKYFLNSREISTGEFRVLYGFAGPRINPYGELTGMENVDFVAGSAGEEISRGTELLKKFKLHEDRDKQVKHYSSGMKQRLKLILSMVHDPSVLILDEPGSNLDREGRDIIYSYIDSVRKEKIIIIATNEEEEAVLCDERIITGK